MTKSDYLKNLISKLDQQIENQEIVNAKLKNIKPKKTKKQIREILQAVTKNSNDVDKFINKLSKDEQDKYLSAFVEQIKNFKNLSFDELIKLWIELKHSLEINIEEPQTPSLPVYPETTLRPLDEARFITKYDKFTRELPLPGIPKIPEIPLPEIPKIEEYPDINIPKDDKETYDTIVNISDLIKELNELSLQQKTDIVREFDVKLKRDESFNEKTLTHTKLRQIYKKLYPEKNLILNAKGIKNKKSLLNRFNIIKGELRINNSYHLQDEAKKILNEMLNQNIITKEEYNRIF